MYEKTMPTVVLSNGDKVANFASFHQFEFEDGTVLPAVSRERSDALSVMREEQVVTTHPNGRQDLTIRDSISNELRTAMAEAVQQAEEEGIDVILTCFPHMKAMEEAGMDPGKFRSLRMVARNTRVCRVNQFCTIKKA